MAVQKLVVAGAAAIDKQNTSNHGFLRWIQRNRGNLHVKLEGHHMAEVRAEALAEEDNSAPIL